MPQLDVSEAILDPAFCDRITIIRRPYTINDNGQVIVTETSATAIGVITQGSPHPLEQTPDAQYAGAAITIHAFKFQLYDAVTGKNSSYQPDLIMYNGNKYIITRVWNWSRYGRGFTMSEGNLYNTTEAGR